MNVNKDNNLLFVILWLVCWMIWSVPHRSHRILLLAIWPIHHIIFTMIISLYCQASILLKLKMLRIIYLYYFLYWINLLFSYYCYYCWGKISIGILLPVTGFIRWQHSVPVFQFLGSTALWSHFNSDYNSVSKTLRSFLN